MVLSRAQSKSSFKDFRFPRTLNKEPMPLNSNPEKADEKLPEKQGHNKMSVDSE